MIFDCLSNIIPSVADLRAWEKTVKTYDKDSRNLVDEDMYIDDNDKELEVANKIKLIYTNRTFIEDIGSSIQVKAPRQNSIGQKRRTK